MSAQPSPLPVPLPKRRESFDSVLAKNLVVARTAARLTQHELAAASRVSRATIAQLETGVSDPRLSTLTSLAEAIGISPLLLLVGDLEATALAALHERSADEPSKVPIEEVERMRRLLRTGLLRDRARAAAIGSAVAATLGRGSAGERASAAILSAIVPDIGPTLGVTLAALFSVEPPAG